jgi:hypothetical protein
MVENMKLTWLMTTLLLLGLAQAIDAGDLAAPDALGHEADAAACHALMTDQECGAHQNQLGVLQAGPERSLYLAQHLRTKGEREQLCDCRQPDRPVTYYPAARQTAQRF